MFRKIALVGYRATGKSTVAKRLSERLKTPVVDTDAAIEERVGKTVARIFQEDGEPRFREIEAQVVAGFLNSPEPLILATGGGAPLCDTTRAEMKKNAVVVWLTASVETIARRMLADSSTSSRRPSLTNAPSPVDEIESVLKFREPLYRDVATFVVEVDGKTVDEIVEEILRLAPDVLN